MALIPRSRHVWFACFISDAGGAWQEVTDALCGAEISLGDTSGVGAGQTGTDSSVRSATITFRSSRVRIDSKADTVYADEALVIGDELDAVGDSSDPGVKLLDKLFPGSVTFWPGDSLHPLDKNSPRNRVAGVYSPLIAPGHEIVLKYAVTNPGVYPAPSTWRTLFHGVLGDKIDDDGSAIVRVQCRDLSKRLSDTYIEELHTFGGESGELAETVIQNILNHYMGANAPTLQVLSPTSSKQFKVRPYQPEYDSVWGIIQKIAGSLGWWLGYKYDSASDSFKLSLLEPPRTKSTSDFILDWTSDFYGHDLGLSDASIRNAVRVTYRNSNNGKRETVTAEDTNSIQSYGRRAMSIEEGDSSLIDTQAEALEFANAALSDLKDMMASANVEMPFFPELDLFSALTIIDPRISTDSSFLAVNSISHRFELSGDRLTARTAITGSEKIIGGLNRWLVMQTRPGAPGNPTQGKDIVSQQIIPAPAWIPQSPVVGVDIKGHESAAFIRLGWKKPAGNFFPEKYLVRYRPTGTTSWTETAIGAETITTGLTTVPHVEYRISGLLPNIQYDVQVQPVSAEGVPGLTLDLTSGAVTPKDTIAPPAPSITVNGSNGTLSVDCGSPGATDSDVRLCIVSTMPSFNPDQRVWIATDAQYLGAADGYSSVVALNSMNGEYADLTTGQTSVSKFPEFYSPDTYMYMEFWAKGTNLPYWETPNEIWVVKPPISTTTYQRYLLKSNGVNERKEYFRLFYEPSATAKWLRIANIRIYKEGDEATGRNHFGSQNTLRVMAGRQTRFDIADLEFGTTYYVRVADIDTSKNVSQWSSEGSAKLAYPKVNFAQGTCVVDVPVLYSNYRVSFDSAPFLMLVPAMVQTNGMPTYKLWYDPPASGNLKDGFIPRGAASQAAAYNQEYTWHPQYSTTTDDTDLYPNQFTPLTSATCNKMKFTVNGYLPKGDWDWSKSECWLTVRILNEAGTVVWEKEYYEWTQYLGGDGVPYGETVTATLPGGHKYKVGLYKYRQRATESNITATMEIKDISWWADASSSTMTGTELKWYAVPQ